MTDLAPTPEALADGVERRRPYDSPLRRQRTAATHERILAAAMELVGGLPAWDWHELTFRAVADRAGVSERTVYRHFPNERELHTAMARSFHHAAGVSYDEMSLDDLPAVGATIAEILPSFAASPWAMATSSFSVLHAPRMDALRRAVTAETPDWSRRQREMAASVFDMIWSVASCERLISWCGLDEQEANEAMRWAHGLMVEAIRADRRPALPSKRRGRRRR